MIVAGRQRGCGNGNPTPSSVERVGIGLPYAHERERGREGLCAIRTRGGSRQYIQMVVTAYGTVRTYERTNVGALLERAVEQRRTKAHGRMMACMKNQTRDFGGKRSCLVARNQEKSGEARAV